MIRRLDSQSKMASHGGSRLQPGKVSTRQPLSTADANLTPARFPRWYLVYFLLAAADILTLSVSLILHHRIVEIYRESVSIDHEWSAQFERYVALSLAVARVNAPGNNVFDTGNVDAELKRMTEAYVRFSDVMADASRNMPSRPSPAESGELLGSLMAVDRLTREMVGTTEHLLALYRKGDFHAAGIEMAAMDRLYSRIIHYMTSLEARSHNILRVNMNDQVALAEEMKTFEYLIATLIGVMVAGVAAYGYKLSRQIVGYTRLLEAQYDALESSEQRFRTLTEGSIQGTIVHSANRPLFANRAWMELHGYPPETQPEDMPSPALTVAPEDRSRVTASHNLLLAGGQGTDRYEYRALRNDGSIFWLECMSRPIRWNGEPAVQSTAINIDKRKRAEKTLMEAKEQAENVTIAKTRFFAAASHDLRQPLYSMSLLLPLLARDCNLPRTRKVVDVLLGARDSMEELLDSILDISKLDAGVVQPKIGPVAIGEIFDKLTAEFSPQAKQKGLFLRVRQCEASALTDPALLERILRNLLSNAVVHTANGGVLMGARRAGGMLNIDVHDTGPGIPGSQIEIVFREFFQLNGPENSQRKGLGLGLAIVDRLVRLLDHRIEVHSVPGRGTRFRLTLPLSPIPATPRKPIFAEGDWGRVLTGRLALLVDDDEWVLKGSRIALESWGCEVLAAENLDQAFHSVETGSRVPDIIIADLRLKNGGTGMAAIEGIRAMAGKSIPAIVITGNADADEDIKLPVKHCLLLKKPIKPLTLLEGIKSII